MRRSTRVAFVVLSMIVAGIVLRAALPAAQTGKWQAVGSLANAASGSAAVTLQDGSVLITGGAGASGALASAQVFGTDGSFASAGNMNEPRSRHTAVVLGDGRVLVAGGTTAAGPTNSAEIYDPSSKTWTLTASTMTSARSGHTATLLTDGRVLLAGGTTSSGATSTMEIFDPSTGQFSSAGVSMTSPRANHAAALLSDGRVLLIGGTDGANALASVDSFDPAAGTIVAAAPLSTPRNNATATTLLNGNVAVIGGNNGQADQASAEIYNASSGSWSVVAGGVPRSGHIALLLKDNYSVLVFGGSNAQDTSADLFTQNAGTGAASFVSTGASAVSHAGGIGGAMGAPGMVLGAGGSAGAGAEVYSFPTVKTDAADYPPGTTVNISGSGFQPNEPVTITLVESPLLDTHGPYTVTADAFGNISDHSFITDIHDLNIRFYMTAQGQTSGFVAQNTFTDAGPAAHSGDGTMSVSPTSVTTSSQNDFTFTFTGDNNGDFNAGSQVQVTIPSGWTAPQSSNSSGAGFVSVTNGTCTAAALGSVSGSNVPINITCLKQTTFTLSYKKATAPSTAGTATFNTSTKQSGGTLTAIGTFPTVSVIQPKLAFTSSAFTTTRDQCSPAITIQSQDAGGNPLNYTGNGNLNISLSSGAGTGSFYSDSACTTPATTAQINHNTAISSTVFYKDTAAGSPTLTAAATSYTSGTQAETIVNPKLVFTSAAPSLIVGQCSAALTVQSQNADNSVRSQASPLTVNLATSSAGGAYYSDNACTSAAATTSIAAANSTSNNFFYKDNNNGSPTLTAAATNYTSGTQAATVTAVKIGSVVLGAQTGTLNFATAGSATYSVTVNRNGGAGQFDAQLSVTTALPTGATAAFSGGALGNCTSGGQNTCWDASNNTIRFANGDNTLTALLTISTTAATPVGSTNFTVQATNIAAATTDFRTTSGTLVVSKGNQTITFGALANKNYGDADFTVSATASSGLAVSFSTTSTACSLSGATVHIAGAGSCTIKASQAGDSNFNPAADVSQSFTINKAHLTVTADDQSKTYDGHVFSPFTATISGFVNSETLPTSGVTGSAGFSGAATTAVNAGSYTITPTLGSLAANNYDFTFANGTLSISKVHLTVTADDQSKTYDGTAFTAFTAKITGFVNGETSAVVSGSPAFSTTPGGATNAGTYTITPAVGGLMATNYDFPAANFVNGTLTISKATPTVTVSFAASPITYDGGLHPATATVTGVNNTTLTSSDGTTAITYTPGGSTAPQNAGSYTASATFTAVANGNYNNATSAAAASLTIDPAAVTATAGSYGHIYDGLPHAPSACVVSGSYTVGVSCANSPSSIGPGVGSGVVTPSVSYTVASTNFTVTSAPGSWLITQADLTITANNQTKTFGDAFTFAGTEVTQSGLISGDSITSVTLTSAGAASSASAGSYPITPSAAVGTGLGNYNIHYVNGSMTVNKATFASTISFGATAVYGQSLPITVALDKYSIGGVPVLKPHADPVNPSQTDPETLTVWLVPAPGGPGQAIKYGSATAVPTYDNTQHISGTTQTGWTATITGTAPIPGSYNAVVYGDDPADHSLSTANASLVDAGYFYADTTDISYPTAMQALTIAKATLTVTASSPTVTYGDPIPTITPSYSGFVGSDTSSVVTTAPTCTTAYAVTSAAGSSPSTSCSGGAADNYTFTFVSGSVSINKRPVTVTADAKSKTYGDADPTLTYTITSGNLVNSDTFTGSLTRDAGENVAQYNITQGSLALNTTNYTLGFIGAKLTINKAHLTVTADDKSKYYDGHVFSPFSATISGFVKSETLATSGVTGSAGFTGAAITAVNAGSHTITPTPGNLAASNYDFPAANFVNGTLTINKAHLTVTADDKSKNYDGHVFSPFSATISGFVNGETLTTSGVTGNAAFSGAAATAVNAGTYTITPTLGGLAAGNYDFPPANFVNATLTINKVHLTVKADDQSKTYDATAFTAFTATITGFVNNETSTVVSGTPTFSTTPGGATNAGTYTITPAVGGLSAANYDFPAANFTTGTLTINKATPTVTVSFASSPITYDGNSHAATVTVVGVNNSALTSSEGTIAITYTPGNSTAPQNAGSYTASATFTAIANGNYTDASSSAAAALTINKRDATWTTIPASKTYGDADPTPLTTGSGTNFVAADNVTATYSRATGETVAGGPYAITATLSPAGVLANYNITNAGASFTINKRLATWTTTPASKTYGDADPTPLTTGSGSGFVAADGVSATYSRAAGETVAGSPYAITATLFSTVAGALDNYTITNNGANFTITKRPATWTTAAASKTYGDADPTPLTTGSGSGFVTADGVGATYSRTAGETVGGGPYLITATLSSTVAGALDNYTITNNGANFTITKRPATWTTAAASKIYGYADPTPLTTGSGTNFEAADGVSATYSRAAGETVGGSPYLITATLSSTVAGVLDNYSIANAGANFTITKRAITVSAQSDTKVYDSNVNSGVLPQITSGTLAAGDKASFTQVFDSANASPTNITPLSRTLSVLGGVLDSGNNDKSGNYAITTVTAPGSITTRPLTVAISAPASGTVAALNSTLNLAGSFSGGVGTTFTATWYLDNAIDSPMVVPGTIGTVSNGGATVTGTASFTKTGVYNVTLVVTDSTGNCTYTASTAATLGSASCTTAAPANQFGQAQSVGGTPGLPAYSVIYDPNAGFVTGGGWINSLPGSYCPGGCAAGSTPNPTLNPLTGQASFGFVSKYQKGANTPTGQTEFNFQVAKMDFHSVVYQWLVVSGSLAQYKGTGTINGQNNPQDGGSPYYFILTARDGSLTNNGSPDGFRIQITNSTGTVIYYDNKLGADSTMSSGNTQDLSGTSGSGSVVIHSK